MKSVSTIKSSDRFVTHNLNEDQVQKLSAQLDAYPQIVGAYLACKKVKHFPEMPLYLLGIEPKSSWYRRISTEKAAEISAKLAAELSSPATSTLSCLQRKARSSRKRWSKSPIR